MKTQMGLWIDHRKAVIVTVLGNETKVVEILSHAEKQPRRKGDSPLKGSYEAQHVPPDDRRLRGFKAELNVFYDEIVEALREADEILVFGPGIAKIELKAQIVKAKLGGHVLDLETVDKMTNPEIKEKVTKRFA